jgi:putative two-component system response regulator
VDNLRLQNGRIMVVDDDPSIALLLETTLKIAGYEDVTTVTDPRWAAHLFLTTRPDLVLLDLHMPHLDGYELLESLSLEIPVGVPVPVLILTGDMDVSAKRKALAAGAKDFVAKPFDETELMLRIKNLLETRCLQLALLSENESLEDRVRARTVELEAARAEALDHLALASEFRDDATGEHAQRVGKVAAVIARAMGQPDEVVTLVEKAAPLHDIGKIGIPDSILLKPGALTEEEFRLMRRHTHIGAQILSSSRAKLFNVAREIALTHHERWDGRGYEGLGADEIPLSGRITALADAFDAMTHDRPYRRRIGVEEALTEIRSERGRQFDPDAVDAFETEARVIDLEEAVR